MLLHTCTSLVAQSPNFLNVRLSLRYRESPTLETASSPLPTLNHFISPRADHVHMPMMADDSDSSGLSEHSDKEIQKLAPVFLKAKKASKLVAPPPVVSPPKPKRPPSPPHEEVLADNGDIAVSCQHEMARF